MRVYFARYRRLSLADRSILVLRTPTDMSPSRPLIVDHTAEPTEIVSNVGA